MPTSQPPSESSSSSSSYGSRCFYAANFPAKTLLSFHIVIKSLRLAVGFSHVENN